MAWSKPTISGNGGAVQYWKAHNGARLVLCRNGKRLLQTQRRRRWRVTTLRIEDIALDPAWRSETTIAIAGAITRTNRAARRAG